MQDETPSSPESLQPSNDLPRTPSLRTCPVSQTRMQQFAGGNDSVTGDQMWGTPRASHGTDFPNSLQKPLPAHADLHGETQQMYRDQQHPEIWSKL